MINEWKKHGQITAFLIIVNIGIFLLMEILGSTEDVEFMLNFGASYYPYIVGKSEYFRLFTCMFLHFGIMHLMNNMFMLFVMGDIFERFAGKIIYIIVYVFGGMGGNIISLYMYSSRGEQVVSAGASGAIFALIGGLLYVVIRNKGKVENLTGSKIVFLITLSLYQGYTNTGTDNWAHLGGLIIGFLLTVLLYHKPRQDSIQIEE